MVDKLTEECTENIDEVKIAEMVLFEREREFVYSCKVCVILAVTSLTIGIGIGSYFAYKYMNHWYLKKMLFVLSLVLILKQQFNECKSIELINGKSQTKDIKNRTYYFYNDISNIEEFNSSLLKIDKKSCKDINIYYIGYITIKKISDCENIDSVNPLYLIIG